MGCSEDEPKLNSFAASSVVVLGLSRFVGSSELYVIAFVFCSDAIMPNLNDLVAGSLVVVPNLNVVVAGASVLEPNLNVLDASLAIEPILMAFDESSEEEPNLKFFKGAAAAEVVGLVAEAVTVVVLVPIPNLNGFAALSDAGASSDSFAAPEDGMPNLNCVGAAAKGAPPKPLDSEEGNLKLNVAAACVDEREALLADGRGFSQAQHRVAVGWFLTRQVSHSHRDPAATVEGTALGVALGAALLADGRGASQAQQRAALVSFLTRHVLHSQREEAAVATLVGSGATGAGTEEGRLVGATAAATLEAALAHGVSQAWQQLAEGGLLIKHTEHDQLPAAGLKRSHRSPPLAPFVLLQSLSFLALEFSGSLVSPDCLLSALITSSVDLAGGSTWMASPGFFSLSAVSFGSFSCCSLSPCGPQGSENRYTWSL